MASAPPVPPVTPSRISAKDLITVAGSIVASAFVIGAAIRADGSREQRLVVVEQKITTIEQRSERREDLLNQISDRTARIEATLQMMNKGGVR